MTSHFLDGPEQVTEPDSTASGVAWGAVLAGGSAAAAISLILLILGVGLGLSAASPWAGNGASANTLGASTIAWLVFTQLAAAGIGGYLAGRLRVKWASVHTDEVYFRDTAHGFLAWAVASLATAAFLTATIGSILVGATAPVTAGLLASARSVAASPDPSQQRTASGAYFGDMLWRSDQPLTSTAESVPRAEMTAIFLHDVRSGGLTPEDKLYASRQVARFTGLSDVDAEKRVLDTYSRLDKAIKTEEAAAAQRADMARKATAHGSLWFFVALLCGAFFASLCATFGGARRDHMVVSQRAMSEPAVRPA
ncbi:hypothetical protein AB4Z48_35025 [Cupriavidus sp. 2TAF22]|uniref:hypothetical protein n=1 Tax=unclassified Cupriavidus TaxID=2640874 RepID=UPI003F91775F